MNANRRTAWGVGLAAVAVVGLVACSDDQYSGRPPTAQSPAVQVSDTKTRDAAPRVGAPANAAPMALSMGGRVQEGRARESRARDSRVGAMPRPVMPTWAPADRETYRAVDDNPVRVVAEHPVSTFSIDVDTASYANVRRFIAGGRMPPRDAVRIEEIINYFDYAYARPDDRAAPFRPTVAVHPAPWRPGAEILHIGIKGFDLPRAERPAANLVFLIDVSGSMNSPRKLPLVKSALRLLVGQLDARDRVAMVVYAGRVETVLEPTPGDRKARILAALDRLRAGGSTAGGAGIERAYAAAAENFDAKAVNRVILATDGDFNVGITDPRRLESYVAERRESGISLSVLGFGGGNINDLLMQKLAQAGDGNAAYIDTLNEARKVLVDQMGGTLFTIARDVKIQVEFNPARVGEYRLIGYETRMLRREDFNNDRVDAGDVGAGHTVTALYEIVAPGSAARRTDPLRYGQVGYGKAEAAPAEGSGEIAFLRLRYKLPGEKASRLIERPVTDADRVASLEAAGDDIRFAAAVAGFGQILRGGRTTGDFGLDRVIEVADSARGADRFGYRAEFVNLARSLRALQGPAPQSRR